MLNVQYRKYEKTPKSVNTEKLGKVYAKPLLKAIKAIKKHMSKHAGENGKQRIARLQFKSDRITVIADDEHQESVKLYLNYERPADVDILLDSLHRSPTYPGLLDLATKEDVLEFEIDRTNHMLIVKEKGSVSRVKLFRLNEPMKQAIVPVSPVVTHKETTFRRLPPSKDIVPVSPVVTHKEATFLKADCTICLSPATTRFEGDAICAVCNQRIKDYVQRVGDRVERMYGRAEKTRVEFIETSKRASKMAAVIPFGQPIHIGHHSEKSDRRYRERINQTSQRAYKLMKKSERQKRQAKSAENNRAISSDDPAAVIKLRDKINRAEADHVQYKRCNKALRKIRKQYTAIEAQKTALIAELGIKEQTAGKLLTPDFAGRYGIPSYMLTNNSANIRRMKKRLEELQQQNNRLATEEPIQTEDHQGVQLVRDLADNRLRLIFDGKPSAEIRALLKQRGFRWSPSNNAWQRKINNSAEYQAKFIMEQIAGLNSTD